MSASSMPQYGPAMNRPKSITRIPSRGSVISHPVGVEVERLHHVLVVAAVRQEGQIGFVHGVDELAGAVFVVAIFDSQRERDVAAAVAASQPGLLRVDASMLQQ